MLATCEAIDGTSALRATTFRIIEEMVWLRKLQKSHGAIAGTAAQQR